MLFLPSNAEARMAADLGMYGQTLLLALAAHGIASCPQPRRDHPAPPVSGAAIQRAVSRAGPCSGRIRQAAPVARRSSPPS
ncbi:hypothetical protein AB0G05_02790 [Nonomuraea wenchangensis]